MKILFIHNEYGKPSGEEHSLSVLERMLISHGHEIKWFRKSSSEINSLSEKMKVFFLGVYNPFIIKELDSLLQSYRPDVAIVQNLYPYISSLIIKVIKGHRIPIVMRCPNYRLFCPSGLCLDNRGRVCEKCFGKGKELWCVWNNCENNRIKSIGYALRNCYTRMSKNILNGVDVFIVQSVYQKRKFSEQGIDKRKIEILPGVAPEIPVYEYIVGNYCAFVGRVSSEKGIYEFIECAKQCPDIPFKVAGEVSDDFVMPKDLPSNIEFLGFLKEKDLDDFYHYCRIVVVPSKWYEGFPNVLLRAMLHSKPVIATRIGAMPEIIRNGENGLIVEVGNVDELSNCIHNLYTNEDLCKRLGVTGREDLERRYTSELIYDKLENILNMATSNHFKD